MMAINLGAKQFEFDVPPISYCYVTLSAIKPQNWSSLQSLCRRAPSRRCTTMSASDSTPHEVADGSVRVVSELVVPLVPRTTGRRRHHKICLVLCWREDEEPCFHVSSLSATTRPKTEVDPGQSFVITDWVTPTDSEQLPQAVPVKSIQGSYIGC